MAKSILLADDDPTVLKMIQQELEARGYKVSTAANGQTAIRMAQAQKPDLIVLDVAMPLATGITAFQTLRNAPDTRKIPIIFLTGMPSASIYPTVEKGSRVAHLKKPVDLVDLVSLIDRFLQEFPARES